MWKQNTEDTQYNRRIDLRGSPSVGYVYQGNCQVLHFIIQQMKGYNLQHTQCNFLFFLSQSPHSEYNIHNDA